MLRRIHEFDRTRTGPLAALGCAYAVMQRPQEARDALRQAASLKSADPLIYYTQGYLEYYYGQDPNPAARLQLARGQFDQAVKLEATSIDDFSKRVIADCKAAIEAIDQWGSTSLRLLEEFNGPDAEANYFLTTTKPQPGEALVLDFEPPSILPAYPAWVTAFARAVSAQQWTQAEAD